MSEYNLFINNNISPNIILNNNTLFLINLLKATIIFYTNI